MNPNPFPNNLLKYACPENPDQDVDVDVSSKSLYEP